jgi:membrane associated rhomboid family serine protease
MFTLPLGDDNPIQRFPAITWSIIGLCIAVFLWQTSMPPQVRQSIAMSFGMIPIVVLGQADLAPELVVVPAWASLLTSMFLHAGWLHIIGNMLFLRIFGDNVEDAMGRLRFILFYLLCGTVAALTQALIAPDSEIPMIGASGAIAGILGAYLMLYPKANVRVRLVNVPALLVLGIWFGAQLLSASTASAAAGGVAFWAHIGGFLCGTLLLPIFKRRSVGLFSAPHSRAFAVSSPHLSRRGRIPTVLPKNGSGPWWK